jgi:hypothetical protein
MVTMEYVKSYETLSLFVINVCRNLFFAGWHLENGRGPLKTASH